MSETLWGVILGGLIGAGTSTIPLFFGYKKWKREKRKNYFLIKFRKNL